MNTQGYEEKRGFRWGRLVVLVAVVGAGYYFYPKIFHHGDKAADQAQMGGAPVSVATVVTKPVTEWAEFSGIFEAVNSVQVRPRISGQIMQIHFTDGAEVKKGQPLFTIDPRPYEAEQVRAKGALNAAESAATNAGLQLDRAKKLIKTKAISQSEYETRVNAYNEAAGALAAAQGTLRQAELNIGYTHITAPISGKISRAEITEGNLVDAGGQAPLLASIVAISPIYASFDVDEQTFLKAIRGVPAVKLKTVPVEVGLSDEQGTSIKATIHSFDNQIKPGSGTIRVRALVANKEGALVPGLFARVRLGSVDEKDAVLINPTAVGTDQSKKFVMVLGVGNKATYTEVTLGSIVDGLQVIKTGLKPGDKIIVSGLQRVRPGAPVTPSDVDMLTLKDPNAPAEAAAPGAGDAAAPAADAKPEEAKPAEDKPAEKPAN